MSTGLKLAVLLVGLFLLIAILVLLRNGKITIKFSLPWLFASLLLMLIGIFPELLVLCQELIGFATMSNFVVGILISVLLFLSLIVTVIVSGQKHRIAVLVQEVSTLKKRIRDLENEKQ